MKGKAFCPCTGRNVSVCPCVEQVEAYHASNARVRAAKRMVYLSLGVLLAIALVALTGCASAPQVYPQGNPYPNGQPQTNVEQWDEEVVEECKQIAVLVVGSEYAKIEGPKPTAEQVEEALQFIYGQCLVMKGRQS